MRYPDAAPDAPMRCGLAEAMSPSCHRSSASSEPAELDLDLSRLLRILRLRFDEPVEVGEVDAQLPRLERQPAAPCLASEVRRERSARRL